jgi:hypothetical protein
MSSSACAVALCIYIYIYTYIYIYIHTHTYKHIIFICIKTLCPHLLVLSRNIYIYIYIYIYAHTHCAVAQETMCTHPYLYTYTCMHLYTYTYMHRRQCAPIPHLYTYTYMHSGGGWPPLASCFPKCGPSKTHTAHTQQERGLLTTWISKCIAGITSHSYARYQETKAVCTPCVYVCRIYTQSTYTPVYLCAYVCGVYTHEVSANIDTHHKPFLCEIYRDQSGRHPV